MSTTNEAEGQRAKVTEFTPKNDSIRCQDCVNYDEDENNVPNVCNECTRFGHTEGINDNFVRAAPDPNATVALTLTIHAITEDGETATVEDRHGNTADLATTDFTHDADSLNIGDTLLCSVLSSAIEPTDLCPDETPEDTSATGDEYDEEQEEQSPANEGTAYIKSETITVQMPLDPIAREEVGTRMADALEEKANLEAKLDAFRKDINARIKKLEKDADEARQEWQDGTREEDVYCDQVADYDAESIIWRNHDTGEEVKRRPMTGEERQYRLPLAPAEENRVSQGEGSAQCELPMGETEEYNQDSTKTCITCGHLSEDASFDLPEACQSCRRGNNGDDDGWIVRRECQSCTNSATPVDMPPCNGCALNPQQAGEADNWEPREEVKVPEETDPYPEADEQGPEAKDGSEEPYETASDNEAEEGKD